MTSGSGLEDLPLIDLFRAEVETHAEVLSAALLALERSPGDTSRLDEMMRAAHSIKGAARVVGVEPAVSVAHVMEDCFVAAQKGNLTLSPADIDVLLRGVDLLGKISDATKDPKADLASEFAALVKALVAELKAMLAAEGKPAVSAAAAQAPATSTRPQDEAAISEARSQGTGALTPPSGAETIISFPEILDATAAEEIRKGFLAAIDRGADLVKFDLRATKDLDVQGLALLAAVPRHIAKLGRPRIALAGVSVEIETVLRVCGLREPYALA
jgi:chemotaxis protein histidine kinase CheA